MASNIGKSSKGGPPLRTNWEKDKVYLYQFGRAPCIPNISPFCLKLETWLRMSGLNYENVETDVMKNSSHEGKLPFIEVNGEQYGDSAFIIDQLKNKFGANLESHLTEREKAIGRAVQALIEDKLVWCFVYYRYKVGSMDVFFGDQVYGPSMSGLMAWAKPVVKVYFGKMMNNRLHNHGMGRHSPEEVFHIASECLDSFNEILDSDSKYIFGDKPTQHDAAIFGLLSQIKHVPPESDLTRHMAEKNSKTMRYLENIETEFWPDWDECTKERKMNTSYNLRSSEENENT